MKRRISLIALASAVVAPGSPCLAAETSPADQPAYTTDGKLQRPGSYREWIYLSSGFDMSYGPAQNSGHHMFDNVFVDPRAYRAFVQSGTWPDKTMLVLELRHGTDHGSINESGHYQSEVMGLEVHVKDTARFPGGWAFFGFDGDKPATMIPGAANCYSCHLAHAAVDTTFVQFYPTLLPIARQKGTLAPNYVAEENLRKQ